MLVATFVCEKKRNLCSRKLHYVTGGGWKNEQEEEKMLNEAAH